MKPTGIKTDQIVYWGIFVLVAIGVAQLLVTLTSLAGSESTGFSQTVAIERASQKRTTAVISTNLGDIEIKLLTKVAPVTVNNFIAFAQSDFYVGTKFHRVVKDLLVQGGDPLSRGDERSLYGTGGPGFVYQDEIVGLPMERGTVAMANRGKPNTNGSQFFVVTAEESTKALQGKYTVFGTIVAGMDVVNQIESLPTDIDQIPIEDVIVKRVTLH